MIPSFALLGGISLFSSAAAAVTHQINVSNNTAGLIFDPSYITAAVGDIVEFTFHPKNHSVTQSSFAEPCTPLPGGFDTGFLPVASGTSSSGLPMRQLTVNDTNPIWIHCQQDANTAASHCGHGMVFAVNPGPPGSDNSFAAFLEEALEIGAELAANETSSWTKPTARWSAPVTHQINVSNNTAGLIFDPSYITAAVGDIVEFTFHPKNHSVTQSSFYEPCTPLPGGFDTGFLPVANGTSSSGLPMRQFTVNDTNPIWIHCQQDANTAASHCGHGMVFAVNPGPDGSSNSFANFLAEALEIGKELAANTTSSWTPPVTHQVNVSNNTAGLIFDPPYITAAVGDIVEFTFHPKNHSVTQSSFFEPCTPLPGGFDTGFVPVALGTSSSGLPTRQLTVHDTNPIWIHCQQDANTAASHCGHGMVFAVNPGPDGSRNSFDAFLAEALAVGDELAANTTSSWTAPVTHQINVSNDTAGLIFDPSYITAAVGDIVEFTFHPKNHSVTQSSFAEPCTPLPGGFDTGFLPVALGTSSSGLPTRQFTVGDMNPIWIHCQQDANTAASHCGHGMVFAVNPGPDGSSNSFAAFLAEALEIGAELAAANETETTTTTSSTDTTTTTTSETNTTTTSSWADSVTHQINVSNNTAGLIFDPPYITAAVGDIVEFTFHPKNHSVTQSSFAEPCTPLPGGFDTGFLPVALGTSSSGLPTRQFTVGDTSPIWIHCQQDANTAASHCGHGMVFAVNPGPDGSSNSFAAFLAEALKIGAELAADVTTTTSWSAKPTGGWGSSSTPNKARANGAISLNVDGAMLMTGLGMIAMMV